MTATTLTTHHDIGMDRLTAIADSAPPTNWVTHATTLAVRPDEGLVDLPSGHIYPNPTDHALRQITSFAQVPGHYAQRLRREDPELWARCLTQGLHRQQKRRVLRVLQDQVVAVVSDRYAAFDHAHLARILLPLLEHSPLRLSRVLHDDHSLVVHALHPEVRHPVHLHDPHQAGAAWWTGQLGTTTAGAAPLLHRLVCLNGMTAMQLILAWIRRHVGPPVRTHGIGQVWTPPLDLADQFHAKTQAILASDFFEVALDAIDTANTQLMPDIPAALTYLIDTDVVPLRAEVHLQDELGELDTEGRINPYSRWGLVNALTAFAKRMSPTDRSALEAAAWDILTNNNQWQRITAAKRNN